VNTLFRNVVSPRRASCSCLGYGPIVTIFATDGTPEPLSKKQNGGRPPFRWLQDEAIAACERNDWRTNVTGSGNRIQSIARFDSNNWRAIYALLCSGCDSLTVQSRNVKAIS